MEIFDLVYASSRLRFHLVPGVDLGETLRFLDTHFWVEKPDMLSTPLATLRVTPLRRDVPESAGESVYMRKSAGEFFTIAAKRWREIGGTETVICDRTQTTFRFDQTERHIDVEIGSDGWFDLVELIRDLVLRDQENRGAVILHATAAAHAGEVMLVSGSKGAGKSTILLELVEHFGYQILSGDKTLVTEGERGLSVRGWPDYPHLGYATIMKYPGLSAIAGISAAAAPEGHEFSPYNKYAVDPAGFRARFPSALGNGSWVPRGILHASIGPGENTVVCLLRQSVSERVQEFDTHDESAFSGQHADWMRFIPDRRAEQSEQRARTLAQLAELPAWTVHGPGDLIELPFKTPGVRLGN
ncbi:hypothetical protein [Lysinibacter sp. HNR]|uniref:hypothetical protein n=1 Tax=Lysinibacter sp. HNR TaxID=3031408 RepID=UPI0024350331|nr:hypothetical protein [Lysinibacter sp. HNR]WGD37082.1 hypothetical protein FrondiHNR_11660 [Lysinibacter sp. HNR]